VAVATETGPDPDVTAAGVVALSAPPLLTVATVVSEELQVAVVVTSCTEPLE
jgi:hypothetical protein